MRLPLPGRGWTGRGSRPSRVAGASLALAAGGFFLVPAASAHVIGEPAHDEAARRLEREFRPVQVAWLPPARDSRWAARLTAGAAGEGGGPAAVFDLFAPAVRTRSDGQFLYVESNGLPAHAMMIGITAWQQQVPLPQPYTGGNAWRIPLHPVPAAEAVSIRDRFLRGAIALAANGIPIFNPQNNRGELSQEIGELDRWGGHCGRADDYHYHAAPLHLQAVLGPTRPIAYALDGYPILGLAEPDGSAPAQLDRWNGHETAALGYHYHASLKYPYVNGGFHGVVVEREGQVDPQPRAQGVREALTALRGARITDFTTVTPEKSYALRYTVNGRPAGIEYAAVRDGVWNFRFTGPDGAVREETYRADDRRGGGGGGGGGGGKGKAGKKGGPPPPRRSEPPEARATDVVAVPGASAFAPAARAAGAEGFVLRSPAVAAGGVLPVEFTGDGESATPPLAWDGAPAGTRSFTLIMHHLDPEGKTKWYWTLYNLPPDTRALAKNTRGVGTAGSNSVNRRVGYAPPHSKGPGEKTYFLTLYALSAPLQLSTPPAEVNRDVLLAAMRDITLGTAELRVVYTRPADAERGGPERGRSSRGDTR